MFVVHDVAVAVMWDVEGSDRFNLPTAPVVSLGGTVADLLAAAFAILKRDLPGFDSERVQCLATSKGAHISNTAALLSLWNVSTGAQRTGLKLIDKP